MCDDDDPMLLTQMGASTDNMAVVDSECRVLGLEESAVLPQTEQNVVLVIFVQNQISPANTSSAGTPPYVV